MYCRNFETNVYFGLLILDPLFENFLAKIKYDESLLSPTNLRFCSIAINTLKLMIEIIIIMLYGAPIFTRRVAADSHSHHESAISNEEPHDVISSPPDHYHYYLMKTNKISKK